MQTTPATAPTSPSDFMASISANFPAPQATLLRQMIHFYQSALAATTVKFEAKIMQLEMEVAALRLASDMGPPSPVLAPVAPKPVTKPSQSKPTQAAVLPIAAKPVVDSALNVSALVHPSPSPRPASVARPLTFVNASMSVETDEMDTDDLYEEKQTESSQSSRRFPSHASEILKKWLAEHIQNPYPTDEEKIKLASETTLSMTQLNNWFINARRRSSKKAKKSAPASAAHSIASREESPPPTATGVTFTRAELQTGASQVGPQTNVLNKATHPPPAENGGALFTLASLISDTTK